MKHLLFDIDGTLLHAGGAGKRAMAMALSLVLGNADLLQGYHFAGKTDMQIINDMVRGAGGAEKDLQTTASSIAAHYVAFLKDTLQDSPRFRLYPHVREVLEEYRARCSFDLALLTGNLEAGARLKLRQADIDCFFSWGVFGDVSEERSSLAHAARDIIVCRNAICSRQDIVIIGDTCNDIRCGKSIQATTVAVVSEFEPEEDLRAQGPDYLIHDIKELLGLWYS